mgnify:CR=1 FL=1
MVPEEEARQQPVIAGRDGDAFLTKDFKRPPGMFAGLMNMLDPFAAMKKMMCYACVAAVVVGGLGLVAHFAVLDPALVSLALDERLLVVLRG